ncbi:MAG: macro domain-containing protein [Clostridia bacterium]|nr:macro domain-containing protein [Clostridia bacterium]
MPLKIIRQDITKIECDAIVNPSNCFLEPGGGADLAIHSAAGPELYECCRKLGGCPVGEARITPAFSLPCKYVIHTAGPSWYEEKNATELLISCYKNCLKLSLENGCQSLALPLIASGAYGFPKDIVLKIATDTISTFLFRHEMTVYLVVYDKDSYEISSKIFCDITSYIDDNYTDVHASFMAAPPKAQRGIGSAFKKLHNRRDASASGNYQVTDYAECCSIDDIFDSMSDGFADTLFTFIDEKGITDVECYKRSNVSKKTFSKIKCDKNYNPSKTTVISFAIGLRLTLEEANRLLSSVGYCLSHASKFDLIIEYFLKTGNYKDIFEVNEVLYKFDQDLLGV